MSISEKQFERECFEAAAERIRKSREASRPVAGEMVELERNLINLFDEEFGRQLDLMPEVHSVGEPDGDRIALEGTFDLKGLATAAVHLVHAEIQAGTYEALQQKEEAERERDELRALFAQIESFAEKRLESCKEKSK